MNPRSAVETAINTHYNPGLHAWGRATQGHIGAVMQNTLGSIEYWTNPSPDGPTNPSSTARSPADSASKATPPPPTAS